MNRISESIERRINWKAMFLEDHPAAHRDRESRSFWAMDVEEFGKETGRRGYGKCK